MIPFDIVHQMAVQALGPETTQTIEAKALAAKADPQAALIAKSHGISLVEAAQKMGYYEGHSTQPPESGLLRARIDMYMMEQGMDFQTARAKAISQGLGSAPVGTLTQ